MTSLIANATPDAPTAPAAANPTAQKIRDLYDKGTRAIRHHQLQYRLNDSYIQSEQWCYKHSTRQEILRLPQDPRKIRATINRMGPESRRLASKVLKRPLQWQVTPSAPDEATIRAAKTAEGIAESTATTKNFEQLREELFWSAWKGGTAALCLDWDTSAGTQLSFDPITMKKVGTGDVQATCLTIAEMCTEPGTRDIERAAWWIKAQALPASEVRAKFKMAGMPQADANPAVTPMQQRMAGTASGSQTLTLVLTYYERPSPQNKQGTVLTVVNDKIVDGPHPWPFPFTDRLNLSVCRETLQEGQWCGTTVLSDAVPIQTALNATWSNILEHLKSAGNARLWADEGSRDLVENLTDEPGEIAFYRDQKKPDWATPPQMPAWWMDMPDRLNASMDDALGSHDISRGANVANIQSGAGLAILAEQDDTPIGKFAYSIGDTFGRFMTMILQTFEAKVKEPEYRTSQISNPGQVAEQVKWTGTDLMGQTTVEVPRDAIAPINQEARFQKLQFLVQAGMIQSAAMASKFLDIPGYGGAFIEGIDPQIAKARRENYELMSGEVCVPRDFDDHAVHIAEHNAERLSARYDRASDQIKHLIDQHVQAHSTMAAEEMAAQQMKAQYAPALASAAQGNQPPGSAQGLPPVQPPTAMQGAQMGGNTNGGGAQLPPAGPADLSPPGQLPPLGIPPLGPQ